MSTVLHEQQTNERRPPFAVKAIGCLTIKRTDMRDATMLRIDEKRKMLRRRYDGMYMEMGTSVRLCGKDVGGLQVHLDGHEKGNQNT